MILMHAVLIVFAGATLAAVVGIVREVRRP